MTEKTLWYTGCSMTQGDEIADIIQHPDFYKAYIWKDIEKLSNFGTITYEHEGDWKSPIRKDYRIMWMYERLMTSLPNVLDFPEELDRYLDEKRNLEYENNWCTRIANKLNLKPIHAAQAAASAGVMYRHLLADLKNKRDVRIMAWTYPYRLTFWGSVKYIGYPPGWQPLHAGKATSLSDTKQRHLLFKNVFCQKVNYIDWVNSIVLSAKLLEKTDCEWFFTFGYKEHLVEAANSGDSRLIKFLEKYEDRILTKDLFREQYKLTDHLHPKAMFAGHPRLEAHEMIAEKYIGKIQDGLNR